MKMKGIMLITFLLLAALTIGAVNAEDNNATSVDLQVADEGDDVIAFSGYYEDEHYIEVNEDDEDGIDLKDESGDVATISLPENTKKGSFRVYNGNEEVAHSDIDLDDDTYLIYKLEKECHVTTSIPANEHTKKYYEAEMKRIDDAVLN